MTVISLSHRAIAFVVTTAYNLTKYDVAIVLVLLMYTRTIKFLGPSLRHLVSLLAVLIILGSTVPVVILNHNPAVVTESLYASDEFYESRSHHFLPRSPRTEELCYTAGVWRIAATNETMRFRGINLPAKTPSHPTHLRYTKNSKGFYESKKTVSFVDRPFPLHSADDHFRRLALYGFNLLRLSVTWEAVMHEGPGMVDQDYLTYLSRLVDKASNHGLYIFVDPHQDVWSRFTGGDGAPWWTLDAVGFKTDDPSLHDTGCSVLHQHTQNLPKMLWATNYGRLATATMFTLFFAGDVFAPDIYIDKPFHSNNSEDNNTENNDDEISIQSYLQGHYMEFLGVVAAELKDKRNVIGFGTMNEPSNGYIGLEDLNHALIPAPMGHILSGFDGMRLGSGETLDKVDYYTAPFFYDSTVTLNPNGTCAWKSTEHDVWKKAGVFTVDEGSGERRLKNKHHFAFHGDFVEEFMAPFYKKVLHTLREHSDRFIVFAEPHIDPLNPVVHTAPDSLDGDNFVWAPHWYDVSTLVLKTFSKWFALDIPYKVPMFTPYLVNLSFRRSLRELKRSGNSKLHVLLAETGVPFDMDSKSAFVTGDYSSVGDALDRTLRAAEANDLDYTMWNYCHDNTNDDGDLWNEEDLSIRSENNTNRALRSAVRPYAYKIGQGLSIQSQSFDCNKQVYSLSIYCDAEHITNGVNNNNNDIMIYVPIYHFSNPTIKVTSGNVDMDEQSQRAVWKGLSCHKESRHGMVLTIVQNTVNNTCLS